MCGGALKAISMFAGIGGICSGFKQAGFNLVWANEIDADAVKTYKHNFGDKYIVESDIRKIEPSAIPDADILTAGFPCQPFSVAGRQKGFRDPRGNLFFEIARVIDKKRPAVIFLENVANLMGHDDGRTFLVIYNTLVQFGYYIKYQVMNAKDFGNIPQHRERIFIVAFLDYGECQKFKFPVVVPLTKKLSDFIDRSVKHSDCYYYNESNFYYSKLKRIVTDINALYKINDGGVSSKRYFIAPTLIANMGTYPDRVPILLDDFGIRKLTPPETLALQGFPDNFTFPSGLSLNAAYKQVGNSVCVPVIKRIAEKIAEVLTA
jgi:DNA (cytosine-5)-methyltransferase 1